MRQASHRWLVTLFVVLACANRASAWSSEWSWARHNIEGILAGVKYYREDFGIYPTTDDQSTWAEKLIDHRVISPEMTTNPSGYVPPGLDGTSYLYIPPTDLRADPDDPDAQPIVRWLGYNGIDDGGAGDDITAGWDINDGYYYKSGRPMARRLGVVFAMGLVFIVIPGVIWWKPIRRDGWAIVLVYLSVAAIIICPLTIVPWTGPRWDYGWPRTIWKAAWATIGLLIVYWFSRGIVGEIRRTRAARRAQKGCCVQCRYDLGGISADVCPECGTSITTRNDAR